MIMTLRQALDYSDAVHSFIWVQLDAANLTANDRNTLLYAYSSIALEHQESIYTLVRSSLLGSGLALLRPQIETVLRGLWVLQCATDAQIEGIGQRGETPFPSFRRLASDVDTSLGADGYFGGFIQTWEGLCGLTHSGLEQLGRRIGSDGHVRPSYPDSQIAAAIQVSATVNIALFEPLFQAAGTPEKAVELTKWLDEYARDAAIASQTCSD